MSDKLRKIFYILSAGGTLFGGLAVTRSYMSGDKYPGSEELYGKTVLITGANRGIGKETAKNLAKRGARILLACKDMDKCQKAKAEIINETFNKNIECRLCDLASLESIKTFTDQINKGIYFFLLFLINIRLRHKIVCFFFYLNLFDIFYF